MISLSLMPENEATSFMRSAPASEAANRATSKVRSTAIAPDSHRDILIDPFMNSAPHAALFCPLPVFPALLIPCNCPAKILLFTKSSGYILKRPHTIQRPHQPSLRLLVSEHAVSDQVYLRIGYISGNYSISGRYIIR